MKRLLIANRGEIAVRILSTCANAGIETVAVFGEEEASALHVRRADRAVPLPGRGPEAYLDADAILQVAQNHDVDAIHPGYGFLSENADFAKLVRDAGLTFIGPSVETLRQLGNKAAARTLATECAVPVLAGSQGACNLAAGIAFLNSLPEGTSVLIKAVAGGGGRGLRLAKTSEELRARWQQAEREALSVAGTRDVYVEEYLPNARHIEVQIAADQHGNIVPLSERDCTLQRRFQKLVEIAPAPNLSTKLREALHQAAMKLAAACGYEGLGTMEFLVDPESGRFVFIEANPRLQVEHTITEEVLDLDLVRLQLDLADARSLADAGVKKQPATPHCFAVQVRINTERLLTDGNVVPSTGRVTTFSPATGPGIRIDTHAYAGWDVTAEFDTLLAKLIVRTNTPDFTAALRQCYRAVDQFEIGGVVTNLSFLQNLLKHDQVQQWTVHTAFVDTEIASLCPTDTGVSESTDPLAVLHASAANINPHKHVPPPPSDVTCLKSPLPGTIVAVEVSNGDSIQRGQQLLVIEAMKMQHTVTAPVSGTATEIHVGVGDTIREQHPLIWIHALTDVEDVDDTPLEEDLDRIRDDLQEVLDRKRAGHDENRADAVARRHASGRRTARENIADLCDPGTFVEYGSAVLAAQRRRRSLNDLILKTTGDGMVCGLGQVNGDRFGPDRSRAVLISYDYMVLAGTQGMINHLKKDRLFEIAEKHRLPVVLFAEGGGGRPGDTDVSKIAGLDCLAFNYFARLSALVPLVGITTGRCFAGNAVLLGCCDVIIATEGSNIGVGGPAMIEGGGLGVYPPEAVGPMDVQVPNGVVDISVKDEAEAVAVAKQYLSYFQGSFADWEAPDSRKLRFVVPEDRRQYYRMRDVICGIADVDSVLELRSGWGPGIITALIRVEGRPLGVIANNPGHLAGAIDTEGADKATRFMQLCDAYDLPILSLCDCPGIMVGPESEKTAVVRHAGRMFVTGANIEVPLMTMITRKGYGLGVMAMAGGTFKAPLFTVTWPTGEFGAMGLEGAVKLGFRKELQAIEDPAERQAEYERMVAQMYKHGKAVNMASMFELDDVIDPADSRHWITTALNSVPPTPQRTTKKRPNVDTW